MYTFSYALRAWRFHILLNKKVSTKDLFHIVCVHNMMNNLLPARTGELSYIYLLKRVNNRTTGEGLATLIVARIFDAIALAVIFFCAILLIRDLPEIISHAIWMIALCIILLISILVCLLWYGRRFLFWIQRGVIFFHAEQVLWVKYLMKKGDETIDSLDQINMKHIQIFCFISSVLIWGFNFGMMYLLLEGMHIALPFLVIIVGGTFILLSTLLPVQGIAGFGTSEMLWTLVFVPLGLPINDAIVSGFCYHIIQIGFFIILGIWGFIFLKY